MQSNSPFSTPPPIPTPDGNLSPFQPRDGNVVRGDWKTAPDIVRRGTYLLTWLNIVFTPLIILITFAGDKNSMDEKIGVLVLLAIVFVASIWLNRATKKGTPAAWTVQIIFSVIGLLGFPLGTIIHAYVLFNWFKPETKAWFGRS